MIILLGSLSVLAIVALASLFFRLRRERLRFDALQTDHSALVERFRPVVDADAEKQRVLADLASERARLIAELGAERLRATAELEAERARLQDDIARLEADKA